MESFVVEEKMKGIWAGIMILCLPIVWQIGCVQGDQKGAIPNFPILPDRNMDIKT